MKPTTFIYLFKNDIRNIFRDKTLLMMTVLPLIMIFGLKAALPSVVKLLPSFPNYYSLFLAVVGTVSGLLGGYIIAFVMLDEKDDDVLKVIRVMPFPMFLFMAYRLLLAGFWAFIFSFSALLIFDIQDYSLLENIFYALLCSQTAVVMLLFMVSFASNKIEGVTFLKGLNFFIVLPVLAFFVDAWWKYIFTIFPFYWTYKAMQEPNYLWILISVFSHFVAFGIGYYLFLKKTE